MARKQGPKTKPPAAAGTKTKPVRVDLIPAVHKALRRKAADCDMSMAALSRKIISEHLGFRDAEGRK
jgi:hypothetical protein